MYTFVHNNNTEYIDLENDQIFNNMNPISFGNAGIFHNNFTTYSVNNSSSLENISTTLSTDDVVIIFTNSTPYTIQVMSTFLITPTTVPTYSSCVSIANFYTPIIEGGHSKNYTHYLNPDESIFLQRYNYSDNVTIEGQLIINTYTPV